MICEIIVDFWKNLTHPASIDTKIKGCKLMSTKLLIIPIQKDPYKEKCNIVILSLLYRRQLEITEILRACKNWNSCIYYARDIIREKIEEKLSKLNPSLRLLEFNVGIPKTDVDLIVKKPFHECFPYLTLVTSDPEDRYKLLMVKSCTNILTIHKGEAIRALITSLIHYIKSETNYTMNPHDILLFVDGDLLFPIYPHRNKGICKECPLRNKEGNKKEIKEYLEKKLDLIEREYDYSYYKQMLESICKIVEIMYRKKLDAIFALRIRHRGIRWEETISEMFEQWLISRIFGLKYPLPDGQAGLWGITFSALRSIKLNAIAYEIELNLLIELLKINGKIGFYPVIFPPAEKERKFVESRYREKIMYLCSYFELSGRILEKEFERFNKVLINIFNDKEKRRHLKALDLEFEKIKDEDLNSFLNKYKNHVLKPIIEKIKNLTEIYTVDNLPLFKFKGKVFLPNELLTQPEKEHLKNMLDNIKSLLTEYLKLFQNKYHINPHIF